MSPLVKQFRRIGRHTGLAVLILLLSVVARRATAATITVTGTGDTISVDGAVTLREAIASINSGADVNADVAANRTGTYGVADTIAFNIPGAGVHTITTLAALPTITKAVLIEGYTQPGSAPNTMTQGTNAVLKVALVSGSPGGYVGLAFNGSTGSSVRGLAVGNFQTAISFSNGAGNSVTGCFLGTDPSGATAAANNYGVTFTTESAARVGGATPAERNLISGNGVGIQLSNSGGATVQGNLVGTDASGALAIGNTNGLAALGGGTPIQIGGTTPSMGNVFSGNGGRGLVVQGSNGPHIEGNWIGTDATGTQPLGNGLEGVFGGNMVIGGTAPGAGNVIAYNGALVPPPSGPGVLGRPATILGNSIFSNTGLGIDFGGGVRPNDPCDTDGVQNFPVLTSAVSSGGMTTIQGTLDSVASATYRIEFFANALCDDSGYGEGQTYLGFTDVTTDPSCHGSFSASLPVSVASNARITATATGNDTSEFSRCIPLQAQYFTVTPCRIVDTRGPDGPWGGPALTANANRSFVIGGQCGIPPTAEAVSFNFTITQPTANGDLRAFQGGSQVPFASTINWRIGQTRANNAVVALGPGGDITVHVDPASGSVHFIADVNGYFQ